MPRVLPFLLLVGLVLTACSSSSSGSTATSTPAASSPVPANTQLYQDKRYKFSFRHPAAWSVTKAEQQTISGVQTWVVTVQVPGNSAEVQVTVDRDLVDYRSIAEGAIAKAPGGADTLHYHHLRVSGWPAIQIQRFSGTKIDEIDTITNTHQYSFDVRMVTGTPPFTADAQSGYNTIVSTLNLPF